VETFLTNDIVMFKWGFDVWDLYYKNNITSNTTFIIQLIFFTLNIETYLMLYIFCITILHT